MDNDDRRALAEVGILAVLVGGGTLTGAAILGLAVRIFLLLAGVG